MQQAGMEIKEDMVIVGGGLAGLATSLALHRLGLRSLVLESSDSLRATGFALTLWTNAWKALDALGIGDILRQRSNEFLGYYMASQGKSLSFEDVLLGTNIVKSHVECRCVLRKELLKILEEELPKGTIRYSSKVVCIEESGEMKLVHLTDGSVVKTKVLIGCDGVNSVVAKWLGLENPVDSGRSAIRGYVQFPQEHGLKPMMHVYFSGSVRCGFLPCDRTSLYWVCTFSLSMIQNDEDMVQNPLKVKQFVLSMLENLPEEVLEIIKKTDLQHISYARLKFRLPWNILLGTISKSNVCVTGDALHPMTPDLGQGGCSALEDGVVLARCLSEGLSTTSLKRRAEEEGDEYDKMRLGMEKYAQERRWRVFSLVSVSCIIGLLQESNGKVINLLRTKLLMGRENACTTWAIEDHFNQHLELFEGFSSSLCCAGTEGLHSPIQGEKQRFGKERDPEVTTRSGQAPLGCFEGCFGSHRRYSGTELAPFRPCSRTNQDLAHCRTPAGAEHSWAEEIKIREAQRFVGTKFLSCNP